MNKIPVVFAALLLICGIGSAFTVKPSYIAIQDTGNGGSPALDVDITIECDSKEVRINVASNETGTPVEGAMAYLFYTDYTYQPLPNPDSTDASGDAMIPVPGTLRFLTAMFTLRVDKQGFQSREIEFTYQKCFEAPPVQPPPPPVNGSNGSGVQANQTPQANTTPQGNVTPPSNTTPPINTTPQVPPGQPGGNQTQGGQKPDGQETPGPSACPAGAALLALLSLLIVRTRG
ncbi:hypothetical protein L0Y65_02460 [Candidatus Micrarchaeota archaeon]|nr:hypothetical protein [Candidatus Micrarchaeota archaeon]